VLYMLDTNIEPNNPTDQNITDRLYGGGYADPPGNYAALVEYRLKALGLKVTAYHMNEGHVLALERIRILIQEEGLNFDEASQSLRVSLQPTRPCQLGLTCSDKVLYLPGTGGHLWLSARYLFF